MPNPVLLAGQGRSGPAVQSPDLFPFRRLTQRFLPMQRIRELYRRAQQPINRSLLENVLSEMQVEYRVEESDLARVPSTGAVLVTANHPFGVLDGAILGALLSRARPDVKVLTNFLLSGIPELHEHCIFVDPFGNPQSAAINRRALRQAVAWLRAGGMLAMFPAGEVSHINLRHMEIVDPEWNLAAARLVRITGAEALPVFFRGRNSVPFQAMGLLHPRLRTTWLLNEFLSQEGKTVEVRVGSTISAEAVCHAGADREAARYLRWRTYLLAQRGETRRRVPPALRSLLPKRKLQPVAAAIPREVLMLEFAGLQGTRLLEENSEFSVHLAEAEEIPGLMQELGRLRELTFRAAGEGTGKSRDLDRFDPYYKHILLWSKANQELIGAYRMGLTADILPRLGVDGLYTSTLFRYDPQIFERLGPALELGRSFIRTEYQRQYAPLLMLWKGIGRFLAAHPELAVLFGAVSVSGRYNRVSRELIVRFFQAAERKHELASLVIPRRPFQAGWIRPGDCPATCENLKELQELADPIGDLECDGKGIPILLKQYAKLGGRIVSFNVDRKFSGVLDGLVLVDLRQTEPAVLARYMGKDGIRTFRQYHGLSVPQEKHETPARPGS
jgi:putative hemolysin